MFEEQNGRQWLCGGFGKAVRKEWRSGRNGQREANVIRSWVILHSNCRKELLKSASALRW